MLPSIFGEKLFDDFFNDSFMPVFGRHDPLFGKNAKHLMKTDVREYNNQYELDIDLPGFKKDELRIELENGYLTISAAKALKKEDNKQEGQYLRRERYTGECSRSFFVGEYLEPEDISASFEDGILKLTFPKTAAPKEEQKKLVTIA
jgi:HSP20 family molecular chaperone IbpA